MNIYDFTIRWFKKPPVYPPCQRLKREQLQRGESQPSFQTPHNSGKSVGSKWLHFIELLISISPVCQGARPSVPWVMMPTRVGTRMPGMVANMLVNAIKVPAKFGARSAWLENTPENMLEREILGYVSSENVWPMIHFNVLQHVTAFNISNTSHRKL